MILSLTSAPCTRCGFANSSSSPSSCYYLRSGSVSLVDVVVQTALSHYRLTHRPFPSSQSCWRWRLTGRRPGPCSPSTPPPPASAVPRGAAPSRWCVSSSKPRSHIGVVLIIIPAFLIMLASSSDGKKTRSLMADSSSSPSSCCFPRNGSVSLVYLVVLPLLARAPPTGPPHPCLFGNGNDFNEVVRGRGAKGIKPTKTKEEELTLTFCSVLFRRAFLAASRS